MDYSRPSPNFELDQEWWWPSYKFGLPLEALFSSLDTQYNTVSIPIQDPEAFHHDVYEISSVATTALEFHTLLADRRKLRLAELRESWRAVACRVAACPQLVSPPAPSRLDTADVWADFLYFSCEFYFDALVKFMSSLTRFSSQRPVPALKLQTTPTSAPAKRGRAPEDDGHIEAKKRKLSIDSIDSGPRKSVDASLTGRDTESEPAHRTPPSSLPSLASKSPPAPDPDDAAPSGPSPRHCHSKVLKQGQPELVQSHRASETNRLSSRIRARSAQTESTKAEPLPAGKLPTEKTPGTEYNSAQSRLQSATPPVRHP